MKHSRALRDVLAVIALAAAAIAFGAHATTPLPANFDLVCTGSSNEGERPETFSTTFRIDLHAKLFCENECLDIIPLSHVGRDTIEYHCATNGRVFSCNRGGDGFYLYREREDWVVSLANLALLRTDKGLEGDIAAIPYRITQKGTCALHAFSGFNGALLHPEAAGSASAAEDAAQFPRAFAKNVLLRTIAKPKFGSAYALWLSQDGERYRISSTSDEGCSREVDGVLAKKMIQAWQSALQLTDSSPQPDPFNRTVFHFSNTDHLAGRVNDSERRATLSGSRRGAVLSESSDLILFSNVMMKYCETGVAPALEIVVH